MSEQQMDKPAWRQAKELAVSSVMVGVGFWLTTASSGAVRVWGVVLMVVWGIVMLAVVAQFALDVAMWVMVRCWRAQDRRLWRAQYPHVKPPF